MGNVDSFATGSYGQQLLYENIKIKSKYRYLFLPWCLNKSCSAVLDLVHQTVVQTSPLISVLPQERRIPVHYQQRLTAIALIQLTLNCSNDPITLGAEIRRYGMGWLPQPSVTLTKNSTYICNFVPDETYTSYTLGKEFTFIYSRCPNI